MNSDENSQIRVLINQFKSFFNRISFISGNKVWFVLIPFVLITAADQVIFIELLEVIQRDLGGYFLGGISLAVFIVSTSIFTLIFGYLSDKYDRKWLLFIGAIVGSIFYFLTAFTFHLFTPLFCN